MAVYKTMKGTQIDMNKLINQNEMTIAVGNMNVNARGDKIGPNGEIITRTESVQNTNEKDVSDMDPEGNE